jgi:group I intron endonuclease
MTAGIYKIENNINHKIYIGCSKNIENRWYHHQNEAFNSAQVQYNYTIHRAFRKYGIKNFTFVILEEIEDERTRFEREKYWILYYDSYKNGYNETEGGDTGPSLKGELNFHAKLTQQEVLNIRQRVYKLEPAWNIYQDYKDKISYSAFKKIIQGRTWKTVFPEAVIVGQSDEYHFINKSAGSKRAWPSSKINPNYNNKK